jgi:hypothetical protein
MADIITHQEDTRAVAAPGPAPRRKRALLGLIAALAIVLTTFISGIGTAKADTPSWTVSHVYMNIGRPGQNAQNAYYGLIQSLRDAAGHPWVNRIEATQSGDTHSLIRLDLTAPTANGPVTVQLWFTANNLYLRGFTDGTGSLYYFNDYDLRAAMQPASNFPATSRALLPAAATSNGPSVILPYGSDYTSMVQAAQRNRSDIPISYEALGNASLTLAAGARSGYQNLARALMFMIQYTSESARFYDVWRVMNNIMGTTPIGNVYPPAYNGVPAAAQEYENNWSQISQYALDQSNGTNPAPLYVGPNAGTLNTLYDAQQHLAEAIGIPSQVSTNPLRDEL